MITNLVGFLFLAPFIPYVIPSVITVLGATLTYASIGKTNAERDLARWRIKESKSNWRNWL